MKNASPASTTNKWHHLNSLKKRRARQNCYWKFWSADDNYNFRRRQSRLDGLSSLKACNKGMCPRVGGHTMQRQFGCPTNAWRSRGQWAVVLRRLHCLGPARSHSWNWRRGCRAGIRIRIAIATIHLNVTSFFHIIPPLHLTKQSQHVDLGQQLAPS